MIFRHHQWMWMLLAWTVLSLSGCGTSALPPPITVEYRSSLLGFGKVITLHNESNHHLYNVRVVGRNFQEVSSASVKAADHLPPGDLVEVGWLEFGSWTPQSGETVEVYAENYLAPRISIIPSD